MALGGLGAAMLGEGLRQLLTDDPQKEAREREVREEQAARDRKLVEEREAQRARDKQIQEAKLASIRDRLLNGADGSVLSLKLGDIPPSVQAALSMRPSLRIAIHRMYEGEDCTSGYISVNGTVRMYALERPWRGNKPKISSIPVGTYKGTLRYDHIDRWRIELQGVHGRTHVQLHIGNTLTDTEGCILVGKEIERDLCKIKGQTSAPAYRDLKRAFYGSDNPVRTPDKEIVVIVQGQSRSDKSAED